MTNNEQCFRKIWDSFTYLFNETHLSVIAKFILFFGATRFKFLEDVLKSQTTCFILSNCDEVTR